MTLNDIEEAACDTMLSTGQHIPQLIVVGTKHIGISLLNSMPNDFEDRQKALFNAGYTIGASKKLGIVMDIYFIAEAWMSILDDHEIMQKRPSEDPKRIEVLAIHKLDLVNNAKNMSVFRVIRNSQGKIVKLQKQDNKEASEIRSPLVEAFAEGYHEGYLEPTLKPSTTENDRLVN